jgi:hypothetical protein
MSWDYRVICKNPDDKHNREFGIYEVYYDDDGIIGWVDLPVVPLGTLNVESLYDEVRNIRYAIDKPVLKVNEDKSLGVWHGYGY